MNGVACAVMGYLVETVNPAFILGKRGTELHVNYLWDKEAEIQRVTKILGDDRVHELV